MAVASANINIQVTAQTQQAEAAMAKLQQRMTALQAAQSKADISGAYFNPKLDTKMASQIKNMDLLTEKVQKGKITLKEYNAITKEQNGLLDYQRRLVDASYSSYKKLGNGTSLVSLDVPQVNKATSALQRQAVAAQTAAAAYRALGQSIQDQGKNQAFMGRQALLSVTAPIALATAGPAIAFYQVDKQLTELVKVYGDSSDAFKKSTAEIRADALDLANRLNATLATSTKDTLELAAAYAALGKSGDDLDSMVEASARAMRLGNLSTEQAQKTTETLSSVFGIAGKDMNKFFDYLNTVENSTILKMQDFTDAFPRMGPLVKLFTEDAEVAVRQSATLLEAMKRGGIEVAQGSRAFQTVIARISRGGKPVRDASEMLGIDLPALREKYKDDVAGLIAEIGKSVVDLENAGQITKVQTALSNLFGADQYARGTTLVKGTYLANEAMKDANTASNAKLAADAQKEIGDYMNTEAVKFDQLLNRGKMLLVEIGQTVLPVVNDALTVILNIGEQIVGAFKMLPDFLQSATVWLAALVAMIGPMMLMASAFKLIRGSGMKAIGGARQWLWERDSRSGGARIMTSAERAAQLGANGELDSSRAKADAKREKMRTRLAELDVAKAEMSAAQSDMDSAQRRQLDAERKVRASHARMQVLNDRYDAATTKKAKAHIQKQMDQEQKVFDRHSNNYKNAATAFEDAERRKTTALESRDRVQKRIDKATNREASRGNLIFSTPNSHSPYGGMRAVDPYRSSHYNRGTFVGLPGGAVGTAPAPYGYSRNTTARRESMARLNSQLVNHRTGVPFGDPTPAGWQRATVPLSRTNNIAANNAITNQIAALSAQSRLLMAQNDRLQSRVDSSNTNRTTRSRLQSQIIGNNNVIGTMQSGASSLQGSYRNSFTTNMPGLSQSTMMVAPSGAQRNVGFGQRAATFGDNAAGTVRSLRDAERAAKGLDTSVQSAGKRADYLAQKSQAVGYGLTGAAAAAFTMGSLMTEAGSTANQVFTYLSLGAIALGTLMTGIITKIVKATAVSGSTMAGGFKKAAATIADAREAMSIVSNRKAILASEALAGRNGEALARAQAGFISRGTESGSKQGAKSLTQNMGAAISNLKTRLVAMLPTLGAIGLGIAVAAAAGYTAYRLATAEARKLKEENDKITKSIEGWAKVLDFTPAVYGQIRDASGDVQETTTSLAEKMKDDPNLSALVKRLQRNMGDYAAVKQEVEQEISKLRAAGLKPEEIQKALDVMFKAANLPAYVVDKLKVEIGEIEVVGKDGVDISAEFQNKIDDIFKGDGKYTRSGVDNILGHLFDDSMNYGNLTDEGKGKLNDVITKWLNDINASSSDPEAFGNTWSNIQESIVSGMDHALEGASPEVRKLIEEKGIYSVNAGDLRGAGASDDVTNNVMYLRGVLKDTFDRLQQDTGLTDDKWNFLFRDMDSASVMFANKANLKIMGPQKAMADFYSMIRSEQNKINWEKLSPDEKAITLNWFRAAAGLKAISTEAALAALNVGNIGDESLVATDKIDAMEEAAEDKDFKWTITVDMNDGRGELEISSDQYMEMRKKNVSDMMQTASDVAEANFADSLEAMKADAEAQTDALDEKWKAADKAFKKGQDAEKKAFDDGWKEREKREKKVFEDRIAAIDAVQEREDDLERNRQRNSEREEARLKRLAELMQTGIDFNFAMAGGNLDEAARISLNAQVAEGDFNRSEADREAGYVKEDGDRARKTEIDKIKEEQDAHMEMLANIKEAERTAMEERLVLQQEEFDRRREAEKKALSDSLAAKQAAEQAKFEASKKAMQMELDTLNQFIPTTEQELWEHKARVEYVYNKYGIVLTGQGNAWANIIGETLVRRMDEVREQTANDQRWKEFGRRVGTSATDGAFNMNIEDFNHFLRTGQLPGERPEFRHGGGPIGGGAFDNRAGRSFSAPLGGDEKVVVAQKGEFMMGKKAVSDYGSDFMHAINNGTFTAGNAGPGMVSNINAIGGFGPFVPLMQAAILGSVIRRTVEGVGTALMAAQSGDIGSINIPQKAGVYGNSSLNETQLKTAALIAETAKSVGASKRDLTIAFMTAFQESLMGTAGMYTAVDNDSLGPFQQRAPWGPAADRMDIRKSARMFFLGGLGGQPGLFDYPQRVSMSLGDAAQKVQVSAHPRAYDKWQDEAEALIAAGVGTSITTAQLKNNLMFGGWTTTGIRKFAEKFGANSIGAGGPMNVQPGEYQHPVPGAIVTSEFGQRWGAHHDGIDFGASTGTPVYATKAGLVTIASDRGDGFGNHVVIAHDGGITSGYAHLSRFASGVGQQVAKGQNIGFVGSTGYSTGPHLHFQLGRGQDGGRYGYSTNPRAFGIPGLAVGGIVGFDNTIANLHKDEAVLTAPLSKKLKDGIDNIDNTGGGDIHIELAINAPVYGVDHLEEMFATFKRDLKEELKSEEIMKNRRVANR